MIASAITRVKLLIADRPALRPAWLAGGATTLLRTTGHDHLPEIWCRCDEGPRVSFRSPAQAHAAALSVEVRYGGVDILADPGTCCYHRFPWSRHARARVTEVIDDGDVANWAAEHEGYLWLGSPVRHRRSVFLDRASRIVDIVDQIDGGGHDICPSFHFGAEIHVELDEFCAFLSWPGSATPGAARLELPLGLNWTLHHGETDTLQGLYPHDLGRQAATFTLLGRGRCVAGTPLATRLEFSDAEMPPKVSFSQAVSWSASGRCRTNERETQAEAR